MADSAIGSLPAVQLMQAADLFVLEQNGEAKKLSGELLSSFIDRQITSVTVVERAATAAYTASYNSNTGALTLGIPRGVGIASISNPVVSGLNKTYTITFDKPASASSATTKQFTVKDGNAITSVQPISAPHNPGENDRYQINFSEGSAFVFEVYNGQDGYGSPGSRTPLMDGAAAVGTANAYAHEDHIHPTDTSRQAAKLKFTNKGVSRWVVESDPTYQEFPVRGEISCTGVRGTMFPIVTFDADEAGSGDFAPNAVTGSDFVYIYAAETPGYTVSIPSIVVLP